MTEKFLNKMKKFGLTILLLIAASAPVFASGGESTKTVRNLVVEGNRLFNQDKFHEALEKYEAALALDPAYRYAIYNKAVALVQLATDDNKGTENDPRAIARELFNQVAQSPEQGDLAAKAHYNLGNMAYNDTKYDEAIQEYIGSLRINNDNRRCRQNLLLAFQQQEQQQNQDQNQDQQDQDEQQQEQQQQQQQEQEQQQQQQEQPQMTQSAEQLLQAMQNKENATRRKAEKQEAHPAGRNTDKPW